MLTERSSNRWIAIGLFVMALLIRLTVLVVYPFDGLYGQDAFAYYNYALQLWNSTQHGQLPAPFYWPLGYPALIAIGFLVFGFSPLAAQVVSLITGALTAPLLFLLTLEIAASLAMRGRGGALLAGLVAAVSGQLLQLSLSIMADASAIFWASLSALALVRYTHTLKTRWLALASFALAYAIITRPIFGALLLPWALAVAVTWSHAEGRIAERLQRASAQAALSVLIPLLLFVIQYGALIPSNSFNNAWLMGWNPLNAFVRVFDNVDGHFEYTLPVGLFYAQPLVHPYYVFPLLTPFALLGLWVVRRAPLTTCIMLIGWLGAVYAFLMGIPYENFRFGLALWPPLLVLAGVGFERVWSSIMRPLPASPVSRGRGWGPIALIIIVLISLLGMMFWSVRGLQTFFATKDKDLEVVRWVEGSVPASSTLVTMGLTEYFKHYGRRIRISELYNQDPGSLGQLTCHQPNIYLVVDEQNIQSQWANREPERNLRWLRERTGLSEWGRRAGYSLYHVGDSC